jgi:hypothetical protein
MPRRPLFCHVCADLLDQLTAAAEAIAAVDSNGAGISTDKPHTISNVATDARSRYFELRGRVYQHREADHANGSQFRCVSRRS